MSPCHSVVLTLVNAHELLYLDFEVNLMPVQHMTYVGVLRLTPDRGEFRISRVQLYRTNIHTHQAKRASAPMDSEGLLLSGTIYGQNKVYL